MNVNQLRSKWAAVGAAIAVSLGAGGIGISHATTSSGEMPIYLPIEPCRLSDTRPDFQVGPRSAPLGPDETYTLDGWGAIGDCNLPSDSTALSLNVTAVDATAATFLTLFPAGGTLPVASHLNPAPGQGPVPNAVNVDLNGSGEFSIYNLAGNIHIIIDVVGIYDDHVHTGADIVDGSLTGADVQDGSIASADVADGSLTGGDIADGSVAGVDITDESVTGTDIDDNTVSNADTSNEPGVASNYFDGSVAATSTPAAVVGTAIRVPSNGHVVMEVTGSWQNVDVGIDEAECQLQKGTVGAIDKTEPWFPLDDRNADQIGTTSFSAHRVMPIALADNPFLINLGQSINLVCDETDGDVRFFDVHISATFFATSYEPFGFVFVPTLSVTEEAVTDDG